MTDDMATPKSHPASRIETEMRALGRCLMPHENNSHTRKGVTLLLVAGWLGWSLGISHGSFARGDAVVAGYTAYQLFTYATIYAFARLHNLEVQNLLGGASTVNQPTDDNRDDG